MPGSESTNEVLDFAALAHSVRPPGAPVAPPQQVDQIATEAPRTGISWVWIAAGIGGILLGGLGAVVIESSFQSETRRPAMAAVTETVPSAQSTSAAQVQTEEVEPALPAAPAPAFVAVKEPVEVERSSARASQKPSSVVSNNAKLEERESDVAPVEAAPKKIEEIAKPDQKRSAQAPSAVEEEQVVEEAPAVNLPDSPSREDVSRLLTDARSNLEACAAGQHGLASVTLKVAPSGRVKSAIVGGAFRGSSEGSCMARALRAVRFPAFTQESFEVEFPYRL